MASPQTLEIVKATVPVLEEHGTAITTVFYKNMFNEHPELLDIFNETNQKLGRQQTALAMTVLAAAKHLENLATLLPQVTQISHKHRALQILPEHYPIVGHHLLGAIKEVLGEAVRLHLLRRPRGNGRHHHRGEVLGRHLPLHLRRVHHLRDHGV